MFVLRVCGVILCNIELKNEGKSNRFTSNLICPVIPFVFYIFSVICVYKYMILIYLLYCNTFSITNRKPVHVKCTRPVYKKIKYENFFV